MSILIKGMEMPPNCWACACYHHKVDDGYYDYDVCQASGTVFNDGYSSATGNKTHIDPFKQRLDNCPLVPVPPHGRLIDSEALIEWLYSDEPNALKAPFRLCTADRSDVIFLVQNAPTIIPAEEGE